MPYITVHGRQRPAFAQLSTHADDWRAAVREFKERYPGYDPSQWWAGQDCGEIAGCCEDCGLPLTSDEAHGREGRDGVWCSECKE